MRSRALPVVFYRNPAEAIGVLRAEEKRRATPCVGCVHRVAALGHQVCAIHPRRQGEAMYRCGDFWRVT